ncbi:ty3-gypsy retrotransposon protein [Cucumis melo var. makuwa]|uniref:Ty3-gypsy retrotransposon protein n=1 Tax=Cucumis melo var. makuwa TaxID=1194695 RepID=A0A5D3DKG2_CUCMM|nr:ty3-gypsy retrotransposon protein [Cucumis melo var. makuwa]TYK24095.1 ty3-gypsy retrotransposon protein [Cucumis melo var. makuwa]
MTSQGNTSKALSDIDKRPNTRSHLRKVQSSEDMPPFERSNNEVPQPNIMSVMVTDVDTSEDRMTELEKNVNMLIKAAEERDFEIASMKNHIESRDATKSSHTHTIKNVNKGKAIMQESQPQNSSSIASLSIQQLQEMIANSIKTQ